HRVVGDLRKCGLVVPPRDGSRHKRARLQRDVKGDIVAGVLGGGERDGEGNERSILGRDRYHVERRGLNRSPRNKEWKTFRGPRHGRLSDQRRRLALSASQQEFLPFTWKFVTQAEQPQLRGSAVGAECLQQIIQSRHRLALQPIATVTSGVA